MPRDARIVLLAKSVRGSKSKFKQNLLSDINPTEIPKQFIESVNITFDDKLIVPFSVEKIKNNFTVEQLETFLNGYDKSKRVTLIEITLDIDKIYQTLQYDSDHVFSKYFKD